MKPRIRQIHLSDLAARSRLLQGSRFNSSSSTSAASSSTSTSSSTRKPWPRQTDFADEWRDQTVAPDALLSSTSDGSSSKPFRPSFARRGPASHTEEPVLKKNPWVDQYKVKDESLFNDADTEATLRVDAGRYPENFNEALAESLVDRLPGLGHSKHRSHLDDAGPAPALPGNVDRSRRSTYVNLDELADMFADSPGSHSKSHVKHQKEEGDLDRKRGGNKQDRLIQFKTAESVDIRDGHLRFYNGEHADAKIWHQTTEHDIIYHRLRDACPCPKCVDPSTRQKTHTSPEAFREIEKSSFATGVPDHFSIRHENGQEEEGLRIDWSPEHTVFFPLSRLRSLARPGAAFENRLPNRGNRRLWTRKSLIDESEHLHIQYRDLLDKSSRDRTLFNTLNQAHTYGVVVIKGVPTYKTDNEDCSLREVMGMIGEIRNTFYGETWNVRNEANSKNVAYTDVNLGLHMDLLYFSSPPRFQALHCLRNRVEGGSSYFVDSFKAAYHILRANPDYSPPPIDYEYDNDGHYIHNTHFLMPQTRGELSRLNAAVNWSPPFQGLPRSAMQKRGASGQTDWYRNLDLFQTTLEQPHREWGFTMEEGDLVLFDNRRVLHARRAFRDLTEAEREERGVEIVEGEPSRWLKGCYLDGEVVWDKLATLNGRINGDKDWAF